MNACYDRANPYFERVTCVGTVAGQSATSMERRHLRSANHRSAVVKESLCAYSGTGRKKLSSEGTGSKIRSDPAK